MVSTENERGGWTQHIHRVMHGEVCMDFSSFVVILVFITIVSLGLPENWLKDTGLQQLTRCPGFSQDRINFHWNPGRGTAGQADPTWPNGAGYSIPCAAMLGSGGGEWGDGNSLVARERAAPVRSGRAVSLGCAVCFVYSPYLYRCCCCSLCLLFC